MWRVVMIGTGLTGIFFALSVAVLAGSRTAYRDPFADYAAIMPGQPSAALQHYPCNFYRDDASTAYCTFTLKEGQFESVKVVYENTIRGISFIVRGDGLHLGDLVLCWGKPISVAPDYPAYESGWADVKWDKHVYAMIASNPNDPHLSYLLPIYYVSIGNEWQSCHSS